MRIPSFQIFAAAALLLSGLASCNSQPATDAAATQTSTVPADSLAVPTATAAYLCPMKCEGSASDKPGKCPVCEMALEPVAASKPVSKPAS